MIGGGKKPMDSFEVVSMCAPEGEVVKL